MPSSQGVVKQGHLAVMLTVNGIESAQRFTLIEGACAPSLALYTIISPAVLQDAYYLRIRGMGPWLPLIDQLYYRRTLFAGLDIAPAVSNTGVLLVTDRAQPEPTLGGIAWTWLEAVALDRAPPFRGLAVVSRADARRAQGARIASYHPVTAQLRARLGMCAGVPCWVGSREAMSAAPPVAWASSRCLCWTIGWGWSSGLC